MATRPPGQVATRRHGHTARRWLLAVAVLAVAAGCAQPGTQAVDAGGDATAAAPATITVGPADGGNTVDLQVGDRLIVELGAAKQPSRPLRLWRLQLPRTTVLKRIDSDSTLTRVVLVAEAPGTVRLVLYQRRSCDPPLQCPMADPTGQSERMAPPLPAVLITIRVQ
jgi:hypothetical protein